MTQQRLLALGSSANMLAIRRRHAVELFPLDPPGESVVLDLENPDDFAAVGNEVWAVAQAALRRFSFVTGTERANPRSISPGGVLTPGPDGSTALWRTESATVLLRANAAQTDAQDITDEVAGAHLVVPMGGRRILCAFENCISVWDAGRGQVSSYRLAGRPRTACVLFGGRAFATITEGPERSHLVLVQGDRKVHDLEIPSFARTCAAHRAGLVVLASEAGLVFIDARLGQLIASVPAPTLPADMVIDPAGTRVFIANHLDGDVAVFEVSVPGARAYPDLTRPPNPQVVLLAGEAVDATEPAVSTARTGSTVPTTSAPAPQVPFRRFGTTAPAACASEDPAFATALLEQAMCHAALLIERLLFLNRNLGLLARTSNSEDPLASAVVSDSDVTTILAGFRKIRETAPEQRRALLPDLFTTPIAESRAALRQALADPRCAHAGFARLVSAYALDDVALDLVVLAFASDWDLRLGRLFGFLNSQPNCQRPRLGHLLMTAQHGLPSLDADAYAHIRTQLFDRRLLEFERTAGDEPLKKPVGASSRAPGRAELHGASPCEHGRETMGSAAMALARARRDAECVAARGPPARRAAADHH